MPKVIILGGGVAGMSAAHELIERGFEVQVFERKIRLPGGKHEAFLYLIKMQGSSIILFPVNTVSDFSLDFTNMSLTL
jgi:monoamine oxidase